MSKKYKKRISTALTEEMILHLLGLDPHTCSLGRVSHNQAGVLTFFIDGEDFPQIAEGQEAPLRSLEWIKEHQEKDKGEA